MLPPTFASLLISLGLTAVSATRIFSNPGIKTGWDKINEEHLGTVTEVRAPAFKGSNSLNMTQVWDPNWDGRYHSEAITKQGYKRGDTGAYGFAFYLAKDWEFTPDTGFNLAQFLADFSELGCEEKGMPTTMIAIEGDQLRARVKHGSPCPTSSQKVTVWRKLATVTAGTWHTVVIQANWRDDETGWFKMWYDGEQVLNKTDIKTTVDQDKVFSYRVGLYAAWWYDQGYSGNQPVRTVFYDQIAIGDEPNDVDPKRWA